MCVIVDECPELKTAEEDIVVYKYVIVSYKRNKKPSIQSLIRHFPYELNKEYQTTLDHFERTYSRYYSKRGFYSWKDRDAKQIIINVKCIIPKGSKYYLIHDIADDTDTYISDRIKLIELI